ncbi:DinB family protein [Nocardioides sp. C4-1]|uniref:DinB family protein n=1 Tax=Nocardioides sp. C4-1 TaxID=3151851 RepID=UPI003264C85B
MSDSPAGRLDPRFVDDEVTMLRAYLDYQRETFRWKTRGLTKEQLGRLHPPSALTLAGLVKHAALVEDWWFGVCLRGTETVAPFTDVDFDVDPEWEFRTALDDEPEYLHGLLDSLIAASDAFVVEALAGGDGADALSVGRHSRTGEQISLRWILLHMIEEYARHNGHADLIRESVDGLTGE